MKRVILGLLLALRGRARRREQERQLRRQSEAKMREAERLTAEAAAATARGERERLPELAEQLEQAHEQVRRRRAEPPPTVSREIVAAPRFERAVLVALLVAVVGAISFAVLYVAYPDTQLLGLSAGVCLIGFAVAAVIAGKKLVPQEKAVTEYHWFGDPESRGDIQAIVAEAGDGISRRKLLVAAAGCAGATAGAAALFPAASLGPSVGDRLVQTPWKRGRRLVDTDGNPIKAADVQEKALVLALPEGSDPRSNLGDSINVLRFAGDELDLPADRKAKCPEGIVAYSRICTHAGCAVSLYRAPLFSDNEPSDALVCPCHYSTFDPRRGCAVEFGPASRPLPQLPLRINAAGELEADGDFYGPIGPSYGRVRLQGSSGS